MALKYLGDGTLKGNLTVESSKPLDTRAVVDSLADLYAMDGSVAYVGMPVVVVEENAIYILKDVGSIGTSDGWKKVGTIQVTTEDGTVDLTSLLEAYATTDQLTTQVDKLTSYIDESVKDVTITMDSEVTKNSERPVKSSGIYKAINAKCVYLTLAEYEAMSSHDENVFYFIKDD